MRFIAEKRGALLYSCHFATLSLAACGVLALRFIVASLVLAAACLLISAALYFRLCHCEVFSERGFLHIHRGYFFPVHSSIPMRFVSGGKVVASPLARILGVCVCYVYSSGKTSIVFGISAQNAESLLAIVNQGGA